MGEPVCGRSAPASFAGVSAPAGLTFSPFWGIMPFAFAPPAVANLSRTAEDWAPPPTNPARLAACLERPAASGGLPT